MKNTVVLGGGASKGRWGKNKNGEMKKAQERKEKGRKCHKKGDKGLTMHLFGL